MEQQHEQTSVMDDVRQKIIAMFFRGDVLGQAARVKNEAHTKSMQQLAATCTGQSLQQEDEKRKSSVR